MPTCLFFRSIFIVSCFLLFYRCTPGDQVEKKPNVLIVLTDDQGWGDLGIHGNTTLQTPNIDSFAHSAVQFKRFYVSPVCAPTRASILTGRYHLSTGTSWVTHRKEVMRAEEVTLAELLSANGYRTGLFGKWHNGEQYPTDPIGQGFDEFFGFKSGHLNNYFDTKLVRNFSEEQTKGYVPDLLTEEAIRFISQDGPFFCMVTFNTPHSPFQVPDKYFEKYKDKGLDDKTAAVYGMMENLDENFARILKALRDHDKEENTIIIFLSDNGPNGVRFNGGFKGTKASVDEGGVRVPFFIRYPDQSIQEKIVESFAAHIDILPTIAELTGVDIPDSLEIHGNSLMPLMEDQGNSNWTDRFLFTHQVVREFDTIPGAVRSNQYLLTLYPADTSLYDLLEDPLQKEDLAAGLPDVVKELCERYSDWFSKSVINGIDPPLVQVGYDSVPEVLFPAPDGNLYGALKFKGGAGWANDWIKGWQSEVDSLVWKFSSVDEQTYDIVVQLANDEATVVNVSIDDKNYSLSVQEAINAPIVPNKDRIPRTEVEERIWPDTKVATVTIPRGMHSLKVFSSGQKDLEFKSLILKKV